MSANEVEVRDAVATESPPGVQTIELGKSYGDFTAVEGLDLTVPKNTIYGLIGPNGAGKTTTFLVLSTLLAPSVGRGYVAGFDATDEPLEVRKRLGYMPDFFGVYDDVKVREYLEFFAAAYRLPANTIKGVVGDLLELVDLSHKSDTFVEALSRGMKQRLGLARALVHDPEVLILDEPASGLDPRARVELRELLLELRRMGKTVLISSHILSELEEVCTFVGILEAGNLLVQGRPSEIASGAEGGRSFKLRLATLDATDDAVAVLQAHPSVISASGSPGSCDFFVTGDDDAVSAVLVHLIREGLPIVEFTEVHTGLEDLFMQVTKGIVR